MVAQMHSNYRFNVKIFIHLNINIGLHQLVKTVYKKKLKKMVPGVIKEDSLDQTNKK